MNFSKFAERMGNAAKGLALTAGALAIGVASVMLAAPTFGASLGGLYFAAKVADKACEYIGKAVKGEKGSDYEPSTPRMR
jgi:hypothetical protein